MGVPAIEIVFTNVGKHTIEDESTKDGADWLEAFRSGAQIIPGCIRAGWGVSDRDSQVVMHFIDYENRRLHDEHKKNIGGPIPAILQGIMSPASTDLYIIHPNTSDRSILYAPQTKVAVFWGIDDEKFDELAPEFFTAISKSDACLGYIWGEIQPPFLSDASGNGALGRGGIMISGWRSREEHDRDVQKPRVVEAYAALNKAAKKSDTWGMQVAIVENNGHFHKWRRLNKADRSNILVVPGNH